MKKTFLAILVLTTIIIATGCTNKEGDSDLDIITPVDSTQGKLHTRVIPKT